MIRIFSILLFFVAIFFLFSTKPANAQFFCQPYPGCCGTLPPGFCFPSGGGPTPTPTPINTCSAGVGCNATGNGCPVACLTDVNGKNTGTKCWTGKLDCTGSCGNCGGYNGCITDYVACPTPAPVCTPGVGCNATGNGCPVVCVQSGGVNTGQKCWSGKLDCTGGCGNCGGNNGCITDYVACPTPAPCPGTGIPSTGWGGNCSPAGAQQKLACGTFECSVAQCTQYSGSTYCWYNSGACYNDPVGCASVFNGYTQTNYTCNTSRQWVQTGQSCVATCKPNCNSSPSCGSCGVQCGQGLKNCTYTRYNGSDSCTQVAAPPQQCTNVCPNGQQCKQNFCVASNTITGNVFVDVNKNTLKDAGEGNYSGQITITSTGGTVTTASGSYTVNGLTGGTYTVSYTNLPTGYSLTYPLNGPPPSFTVQVGATCSIGGSNSASCDPSGNISNLNFGITNSNPWIQIIGSDGRIDSGFNDPIPQAASCGAYASTPGSQSAPGIIFSGASSYTFGQGQASQNPYNWVAGGLSYPDSYGPVKSGGLVKTGFSFLQSKASQAGLNIVDISAYCSGGITNCTLSGTIPHGVYIANGSMTIVNGSFTFPTGQNYVILVNGDLTIKGKIFVPNGSTAVFSASGNINVDKSVGESSVSSTASDIEGVYSSDKSFILQGTNNCSLGNDTRFNVAGAVITNAAGNGGSFQNLRDLCAGNVSCPAFSTISRPDLILNTPDFMKQANFTYQEIAP